MSKWTNKKPGDTASPPEPRPSYEEARSALASRALEARQALASHDGIEPEFLYYLSTDSSPEVRRLVAANPATPQQANSILSEDSDDEVRCELAGKIGRLVPGLDPREQARIRDMAIEVMERLAQDSLPRVRAILAEEIKSSQKVPSQIVQQLARDLELIVCAPVLEYSPLLSDRDLVELVAGARVEGMLAAIARRSAISRNVSDAILATFDVSAVTELLANPNVVIREETLEKVIEQAAEIEAWHKPIVMRADLSARAVRRIAGFVSSSLLRVLGERSGLDEDTATLLRKRVRERIEQEGMDGEALSPDDRAREAVSDALARGELNDEFIITAAENGDRRLVSHALALLAGVPRTVADKILHSRSGKAITALVWRAKLPMRVSVQVQVGVANLFGPRLLLAREGIHFPMTQEEMDWYLGFFGIKT